MADWQPPAPPPSTPNPLSNYGDISKITFRVDSLEQGMTFLVGSTRYPKSGRITEIDLELISLHSEIKTAVDAAFAEWIASPEMASLLAGSVVTVLHERRSRVVKALGKPAIQVLLGVITTLLAALLILSITGHTGVTH